MADYSVIALDPQRRVDGLAAYQVDLLVQSLGQTVGLFTITISESRLATLPTPADNQFWQALALTAALWIEKKFETDPPSEPPSVASPVKPYDLEEVLAAREGARDEPLVNGQTVYMFAV